MFSRIYQQASRFKQSAVTFASNAIVKRVIRSGRVLFVSYTLYQCGYQSGLLDYAQDTEEMDKNLLSGVLSGNEVRVCVGNNCGMLNRFAACFRHWGHNNIAKHA